MLTARNKERAHFRKSHATLAGYDPIRQVAAQECKLDYKRHDGNLYSVEQRTQLSRATPNAGRAIFDGQTRATGRPLAPLPRY